MSILPAEILAVAEFLNETGGEPEQRSVVSRAYYAAYHSTIEAMPLGFEPDLKSASSHEAVVDSVKSYIKAIRPGRQEAVGIADALPKLKRKRKIADYRLDETVSKQDASDAIREAKTIINHCLKLIQKTSTPASAETA